jgi:glycosyltransferase involved in cell wall biosynthesis
MSAAVILPVRDVEDLIGGCVDAVLPEVKQAGGQLVVVDDASRDRTALRVRSRDLDVVQRTRPGGPYEARNDGWRRTEVDVLVFVDARTRPRPGWLAATLRAVSQPGVAVAGGPVHVSVGSTLAQRTFQHRDGLSTERSLAHPFLPFVSTCNLATRREVLEALDGFDPAASGGDLDLCWRAQLRGLGSVVLAPGGDVDWIPRTGLRDLLRQSRKYGAARPVLEQRFAGAGLEVSRPHRPRYVALREVRTVAGWTDRDRTAPWPVALASHACDLATWWGHWTALRS